MQNVFRRDGLFADAAFSKSQIFRDGRVEMVAHHQHVEMFIQRILGERPRRIGRRGQHIFKFRHAHNVGCVTATCAFRMESMNGAAFERFDRVFDKAGFIQRVTVQHHLHIVVVCH